MNGRVVDARLLLFLARLERLPLLRLEADHVLVPSSVLQEIRQKSDPVLDLIQVYLEDWLQEGRASTFDNQGFLDFSDLMGRSPQRG